jgi:hypothetical protein
VPFVIFLPEALCALWLKFKDELFGLRKYDLEFSKVASLYLGES